MAKVVAGYKVVRTSRWSGTERLLSAAVYDPEWTVAYAPGIPTYGRGRSALFGFDSLSHARRFMRFRSGKDQIWEARLGQPKPRKRLCRWIHNYLRFWAGNRRDTFQAPIGTLACESITLLKQVT